MPAISASAVESANLILKLYELRREETMRKARDFMFGFDPRSIEDLQAAMLGPDSSYIRMTISFWEMAASFVVKGAIDPAMFEDSNGEHLMTFAKVQPFLTGLRQMYGNPGYLKNLEQVCLEAPGGLERVTATRERIRGLIAARAAAAAKV